MRKPFPTTHRALTLEPLELRFTPAAPVVLSISPTAPNLPTTSLTSVTFTAVFNEAVSGVDFTDFKVTTSGSVVTAAPVVVGGGGATYSVTVNGIHGSGNVRVDLVDNDSISSVNGALGGAGATNGSYQGRSIQILQTFPTIVSINRTTPASTSTNATSVTFTATFSTNVSGVGTDDFAIASTNTAAGTVSAVNPMSGSVYTITVSGITGEGSLGLNLVDNGTVKDAANGNPLVTQNPPVGFEGQQTAPTGVSPFAVAMGDLNGDGKSDLAVVNATPNTLSVLLGNGDGTYRPQIVYDTASQPRSVAIADFNGDGRPDVIVSGVSGFASVLLGNGDGTFQPQQTFATGTGSHALAVSDINGDGKPDVALVNYNRTGTISVLLGNGDGTFRAQQLVPTDSFPTGLTFADVNGDGRPDLLFTTYYNSAVRVRLGVGDGTFLSEQTFGTGSVPVAVAAADLNGDGFLDMVVVNNHFNSVSTLLGNGDGTFQPQQTFATGFAPFGLRVGDLNGDGKIDAAVTNELNATVGVFLGVGTGAFQPMQTFATGERPLGVDFGDVNGDGKADLAIATRNTASVSVLMSGKTFTGQAFTIDHSAPTASIVPVAPDPRNTPVGAVVVNFNEAVQNVAIANFSLTRGGNPVALSAAQLTGSGSQYSIDLTSVTTSGPSPVLGDYVLTLIPTGISDLAGNAMATGASDSWQITSFTTMTALVANPTATTGGTLVTFTATVTQSPGNAGTVTFKENGVALANGSNIPVLNGVATFQTSILAVGNHQVVAVFNGSPGFLTSTSSAVGVDISPSQPQVVGVTVNGNYPALVGVQRSRVVSLVVAFNQPVQLDANALALVLHPNVTFGSSSYPSGYGIPPQLTLNSSDNVTFVLTFSGGFTDPAWSTGNSAADGLNSLQDGVYDLNIDANKVHPMGVPSFSMAAPYTSTIYRLYGDIDGPGATTGNLTTTVNTTDNVQLRASFNNASAYLTYLDFDGDGQINTTDNLQFRTRFNRPMSWTV